MNTISVTAHGSPNSTARMIQHDPGAALDMIAELLKEIDPPMDAGMSARCRVCGHHPTKHAAACVVRKAREFMKSA